MKYIAKIKPSKFPSMNENDRVVLNNVSKEKINSPELESELKSLGLTFKDVDFIVDVLSAKKDLDTQRDNELKGFTVDNIFLNKEIIKDMAVKFTTLADNEVAHWIDLDNKTVELSKEALGGLVKKGTQKVEEIYFKYRALKDKLKG